MLAFTFSPQLQNFVQASKLEDITNVLKFGVQFQSVFK